MHTPDLSAYYLPLAAAATAALSVVCTYGATYLAERTHSSRMARVVDAMGRIAGDISLTLQAMPPSSDLTAIKAAALARGLTDLRARLPDTLKAVGATDGTLAGMLSGELGKVMTMAPVSAVVPAPIAAVITAVAPVVVPAVIQVAETAVEDALAAH